jgi:tetratricopeptide (TPR) repeat protein
VLTLLVLRPWQISFRSTDEVVAGQIRLVVTIFENIQDPDDPEHLGEIAANLLITDLSESRYIQVVSGQHPYEIPQRLTEATKKVPDQSIASMVAAQVKADWLLIGKIRQTSPKILITAQLVDAASGRSVASQRVAGDVDEDIFSVVDRLTVEVKSDLSLPSGAREETDPVVAEVTTHSAEAYRHYLKGNELARKYYNSEAIKSYERALAYDSTFAMAYYALAVLKDSRLAAKAAEYMDHASTKERYYIRSLVAQVSGDQKRAMRELRDLLKRYPDEKDALLNLGWNCFQRGENEKAIDYFQQILDIDPLCKTALNLMTYMYHAAGDFDQAMQTINRYLELAPDEANPYDTRGDIYAANGLLEEAIDSYEEALSIKPDFHDTRFKLAPLYLLQGDYGRAVRCYQVAAAAEDKNIRSAGKAYLAVPYVFRGQLERALEVLDDGIAADRLEQYEGWNNALKYYLKALVYIERGDKISAISYLDSSLAVHDRGSPAIMRSHRYLYIQSLAEVGEIRRAAEMLSGYKAQLAGMDVPLSRYWYARGAVALAQGDLETSISELEQAAVHGYDLYVHFMLGKAYLDAGLASKAAEQFERQVTRHHPWRTFLGIWDVHLYLGQAYEQLGRYEDARGQYEVFLSCWEDADEGLASLELARERLAALENRP